MKKTNWLKARECSAFFKKNRFIKIIQVEAKLAKKGETKASDAMFNRMFSGYRKITYTELKI